jgi:deoxyribose-phosphate aldolase
MTSPYDDLARSIDHALLSPALTERELDDGCRLALELGVASVCVVPHFLGRCAEILRGSPVKATTTIGFPHGVHTTAVKLAEAERALADGGEELDVVVNVGRVRSGDFGYVRAELAALTRAVHSEGRKIKAIFENAYLNSAQKITLCHISNELAVDWAKTSTGFGPSGATLEDVVLMRAHCRPEVQIKASGGIRDATFALALRRAGATRIGTSSTRAILESLRAA